METTSKAGRWWMCGAAAVAGFGLVTVGLNSATSDVSNRLSDQGRLAQLIRVEQRRSLALRATADALRGQVGDFERSAEDGGPEVPDLSRVRALAGLVALEGPGLTVTLDDSSLPASPSGNVNDLVIHSGDVQAVANGLWAAGAEALSVNGQRVMPTSALTCVGNTLLINGTVHSPPFRFTALGRALRARFLADPLVKRFEGDADRFELGFKVEETDRVRVPAYRGATTVRFARAG